MKKRLCLLLTCLSIVCIDLRAIEINKMHFTINVNDNTATIMGGEPDVQGILTIPEYVMYNKKNYMVTKINEQAFSGNTRIEWINFPPSIEEVGTGAFDGCKELWGYSWPGNATRKIGAYAFRNCKKLQAFNFPDCLKTLGGHALEGCESLQVLIFGQDLDEIPYQVCKDCTGLGEIVIFPGILNKPKVIRDEAFAGCTSLSLVIIASDLKKIYGGAFAGCVNLTNISYQSYDPCEYDAKGAFESYHYEKVLLEIPKGTYQTFKNTKYWNEFAAFKEVELTGVKLPDATGSNKSMETFSVNGIREPQGSSGIRIIKNTEGKTIKVMK